MIALIKRVHIFKKIYFCSYPIHRPFSTITFLIIRSPIKQSTTVYTCLKELLINAIKANFKNIYFEGYSSKNDSVRLFLKTAERPPA